MHYKPKTKKSTINYVFIKLNLWIFYANLLNVLIATILIAHPRLLLKVKNQFILSNYFSTVPY